MDIFKVIKGTLSSTFKIGGNAGTNIKNNSGVLEIKNTADSAFATLRAAKIQSSNNANDLVTLFDNRSKFIEFGFSGSSAPSAGTNTDKFGFCHTSGGTYTAGDVVYDSGSALIVVPRAVCGVIYTNASAISGTISLNANGVYVWNGSQYVIHGDGSGSDTGTVKVIELSYTYSSTTVDSSTSIPEGARIIRVINRVDTAFNAGTPTIGIVVNGSTPLTILDTANSELLYSGQYEEDDVKDVAAANVGTVRATIDASTASAGAGKVQIHYVIPLS